MLNTWTILNRRKNVSSGGGGGSGIGSAAINNHDLNGILQPVRLTLETDGIISFMDDGPTPSYFYVYGGAVPSEYEVRATLISGVQPTGSGYGTWLSLGTVAQTWGYSGGTVTKDGTVKLELRRVSDFFIVDTATINFFREGVEV